MKKTKLSAVLFTALVLLAITAAWQCTKPTKDFIINISSNVIKYTATLHFSDANQETVVPAGLVISLDGQDAAAIYDYSGSKQLQLSAAGYLTLGVDPKSNPTSNTLSFNIKATAPGYLPVNIPITIAASELGQNFAVPMININNTPVGVKAVQPTAAVSGGTVAAPVSAATNADATTTTTASITIPTGTQLRDANNNIINGSSVRTVVAAFDPAQPQAMLALPGGQTQYNVQGGSSSQVFLQPAGFATIIMNVGNTEVRNFSAPVNVRLGLNTTTFNPSTNAVIKAGDVLNLYSFQVQTGIWSFERTVTVASAGSSLVVDFSTTHLTTFAACTPTGAITPCSNKPYVVFSASGINPESSDPFIVDVYPSGLGANPAPIYSQYITIHDGDSIQFTSLPSGSVDIRVSRVDYDHYLLSDYKNRGANVGSASVNLCSSSTPPVITVNYTGSNYLIGSGYAICPNDNTKKYLPPDGAQVYYRKNGSGDQLRILGVIVNGAVSTTLLTPGERYDLEGNYGGKTAGRRDVLIRQGVSFLDSIHIINNGSSFCP